MDTDSSYVVSMIAPLPEVDAYDAAGGIAPRLGLERDRLARLLSRRPGPITRPLDRGHAERIAGMLEAAGVPVQVERATEPTPRRDRLEDAWMGFEVDEPGVASFDETWAQGTGERPQAYDAPPAYEEPPEVPEFHRDAEVRYERRWDEPPAFDWDQPLGFARWRRPALLVVLFVAVAIFVWLQVALSPQGASATVPGAYDRGLAAYRMGDFGTALDVWERAASAGDARALFMLGYMSEFGQGQAWSNRRASEYYRQAAERGSARAQFALASLYERGLGVPHSERTAARWYTIAAEHGHAEAQYRVGLSYLQGRGLDRDWAAALASFRRAAAAGIRDAEAFVAVLEALPATEIAASARGELPPAEP